MGTYSHKLFSCPFYKSDRRKGDLFILSCECCIVRLHGRQAFNEYTRRFCCGNGWKDCTPAAATEKYYESSH